MRAEKVVARSPAVASPIVPQPEAEPVDGRWRLMRRTDGKFIVYDEELPLGKRTVGVFARIEQATALLHSLPDKESRKVVPFRRKR